MKSDINVISAFKSDNVKTIRFKLPTYSPYLPDFVVIEIDEYSTRGGPNILGFPGAENLIPIPCEKVKRESKNASKKFGEFRIGFPLEIALAVTGFKLQGRNEPLVKILMKDFAHVPGLINVSFSRTRSPKDNFIPSGEWPSSIDINLQRLNKFVTEAETFERAVRIISLKTTIKHSIDTGVFYGDIWTKMNLKQ